MDGANITESVKTYVESQKQDNISATHTDGPGYNDQSGDNDHENWNNS